MSSVRDFRVLGANLVDLDQAALDRLTDAEVLIESGRPAAAISMGLYCIEIALKARICRNLDLIQLPRPFEIHDLGGLLVLTGLSHRMKTAADRIQYNWLGLTDMAVKINDLRYSPDANWSIQEAQDLLEQLRNPVDGVLQWLSTQH